MVNHLFNTLLVLAAVTQGESMDRWDESFATGPETLVANAETIVAGPVSHYTKEVTELSQGSAPNPLRWVTSGSIDHPETLKGNERKTPLSFRREEHSPFLFPLPEVTPPMWQALLGDCEPGGAVVAFLGKDPGDVLAILPSGKAERDLILLVRRIVSIQRMEPQRTAQAAAWQRYVADPVASSPESTEVALRSLMKLTQNWGEVAPTLRVVMSRHDAQSRRFAYGIVTYEILHDKWRSTAGPAEFLCTYLASEPNAKVAAVYQQYADLVLNFAEDEDHREQRKALREQLRGCAKARR